MLYQSHNPYSVLSETISFDNVQKMGELITLKTLRGSCSYSKYAFILYRHYVNDSNRKNRANYVLSDAYDLAQIAICFLYEFLGKKLDDVYKVKNGKVITIRKATYNLVSYSICKIYKSHLRFRDLESLMNFWHTIWHIKPLKSFYFKGFPLLCQRLRVPDRPPECENTPFTGVFFVV